jgi:hypothetical protein
MAEEIRADPVALLVLATRIHDAAIALADAWATAGPAPGPPADAFGDLAAGRELHRIHRDAVEEAERGVDRFIAVHEGDVDRLHRVAFAYRQADAEAEARQPRLGGAR